MKLNIKMLVFLLVLSTVTFAQDDTKSNVELPDFVITGKDQINFPPAKKIKPDVISALSEEFINPPYKAEEFSSGEISIPETIVSFKKDSSLVFNGLFSVYLGNLSLPELKGSYNLGFGSLRLTPSLEVKKIRDFEPNSGESIYNFNVSSVFTQERGEGFFSDIIADADVSFYSSNRKLYKDTLSFRKRDLNLFSMNAGIKKYFSSNSTVHLTGDIKSASVNEFVSGLNRASFDAGGFVKFSNFILSADAEISTMSLDNYDKGYYSFTPGVSYFQPGSLYIRVAGGPVKAGENSGIGIDASAGLNLSSALSVSFSYENGWKSSNLFSSLVSVPYFLPDSLSQLFENRNHHLRFETKYSFKHYFEGLVFIKTGKTENMNYFLRDTSNGVFRASSADASFVGMGVDLKFHEGPMGFLYGHAELYSVKDNNDKTLPYLSSLRGNLIYGKKLSKSISLLAGAEYLSSPYVDRQNLKESSSYLDINLALEYKLGLISEGSVVSFKANNLLNTENNYWEGYPGRPADFRIGLEIKF